MKVIVIFYDGSRSAYINISDISRTKNRLEFLTPRGDCFKFRLDAVRKIIIKASS